MGAFLLESIINVQHNFLINSRTRSPSGVSEPILPMDLGKGKMMNHDNCILDVIECSSFLVLRKAMLFSPRTGRYSKFSTLNTSAYQN
jgi:hypothetical protein